MANEALTPQPSHQRRDQRALHHDDIYRTSELLAGILQRARMFESGLRVQAD